MTKVILCMAVIFIIIATAFSAGCIDPTKTEEKRYVINYEIVDDEVGDETQITKIYEFTYDSKKWKIEASVPKYRYDAYEKEKYLIVKKQNPSIYESYFYTHEPEHQRAFIKDEYVENVVNQFKTQNGELTNDQLIKVMTYFVQTQIEYELDEVVYGRLEYAAYPMQALINGKGDCDCHAVLLSGLLNHAGLNSVLVSVNVEELGVGHLLSSIECSLIELPYRPVIINSNGKEYYPIEATGKADIGKGSYVQRTSNWYEVHDKEYESIYVQGELYKKTNVLTGTILLNKFEKD